MSQEVSVLQSWGALAIAAAGTYACRAVGVMVSEKIQQDSEFFRWLSAVTYALVAALVVRMLLLPIGPLATVPIGLRLGFCGVSLLIMVAGTRRRPGLALIGGTLMMLVYGMAVH
jgi:branched-subunit amino acid transport protein